MDFSTVWKNIFHGVEKPRAAIPRAPARGEPPRGSDRFERLA